MTNTENLKGVTYPLGFTAGKNVTDQDVSNFCNAVNTNVASVCQGIVNALADRKLKATLQHSGTQWVITVGSASSPPLMRADAVVANALSVNINITITGDNIPPIINAVFNGLNDFFSNWRVVAGLIATGAVVVGGAAIVMMVNRSQ